MDDSTVCPYYQKEMKHYLEELLERKSVKREDALCSIIFGLAFFPKSDRECLETHFATAFYRCLNLFKNKNHSAKELRLASIAIGLLSIIIDKEDNAHEIYRELLPVLSQALKSGPKPLKELECLAITTFFGSTRSEETESAMQILWNFIQSDTNHSSDVLHAAISAWLFLVASVDGWRFSYNRWQGAVSYFLNLIQNGDPSLSLVAAEGLALIFESKIIDKFSFKEENSSTPMYSHTEETFKGVVLEKLPLGLERLTHQNDADKMKVQYLRILNYFQSGCFLEISEQMIEDKLTLSHWSQVIQFNFLKSFLGDAGFYIHMQDNKKLQDLFECRKKSTQVIVFLEDEPPVKKRFVFEDRHIKRISVDKIKERRNLIKGLLDKEKTILMNKDRKFAEERKLAWLLNE